MARAKSTDMSEITLPYLNPDGSLTKLAERELSNPFDPNDIIWKPTNVKAGKCVALAYTSKRVYEERLDQVFGPTNWGVEITKVESPEYRKIKAAKHKDWKDPNSEIISPEEIIEGNRVMVVVRLTVNGFLPKESSGVSETEDENSITTAEAQAFKRAASMLGVGKYLYFLPKYTDCEYSYGKIKNPPQLPDWAIPSIYCEDCAAAIKTTEFKTPKDNTVQSWNPLEIVKRSQAHFNKNLCMDCMRKRREAHVPATTTARLKPAAEAAAVDNAQAA